MLNISKHRQVLHHRVTYRAVIPKIGHILSPSDHANQMAGEKPQFDNLKSKIGLQWTMQWIKDSNILIKQGEQLKRTVEW